MTKQILVILAALIVLSGCKAGAAANDAVDFSDYASQECWVHDAFGLDVEVLVGGFNHNPGLSSTCEVFDPNNLNNSLASDEAESLSCEVEYNGGTFVVDAYNKSIVYEKSGDVNDGANLTFSDCTLF